MTYDQLNEEQKQKLQASLYADIVWGGERFGDDLTEKEKNVILKNSNWGGGNIPEKIMKKVFDCYNFVNDDF